MTTKTDARWVYGCILALLALSLFLGMNIFLLSRAKSQRADHGLGQPDATTSAKLTEYVNKHHADALRTAGIHSIDTMRPYEVRIEADGIEITSDDTKMLLRSSSHPFKIRITAANKPSITVNSWVDPRASDQREVQAAVSEVIELSIERVAHARSLRAAWTSPVGKDQDRDQESLTDLRSDVAQ